MLRVSSERRTKYLHTNSASSDAGGFRTPATPNGLFNRTLKAQLLVNDTGMTPAMCIEFCSDFQFPYGFAGVELGQVNMFISLPIYLHSTQYRS